MRERTLMIMHYLTGLGILVSGTIHVYVVFLTVPANLTAWESTLSFDGFQFAILPVYRNLALALSLEILLICTTYHGLNGLRIILYELFQGRSARTYVKYALFAIGALLLIYGTRTIIIAHSIGGP
ncbi:MAG: hypothetical protein NZ920_04100 [Aigarchaeota archaeon]|nr:hypothetical protein [Aigarchaeota archaeon]MDW8092196.1 hypothetical protein [Nitrososphaerota archaeon]